MHDFKNNVYVDVLEPGLTVLADANYPASGSYIDVSGFGLIVFLIALDTVATPDFQVKQDTSATETASIKDVTGAAKTDVVTGDDGKWLTIEIETRKLDIQNGFRYVTLNVANSGGPDNATIIFMGCRPHTTPVVQPANYYAKVQVAG